jgi:dTMP kinase
MSGVLIAFEGLDGCGKSTQAARLARVLGDAGHRVLLTREPTGGTWGRRIREMAAGDEVVPAEEELRWFVEDRREHVEGEIRPALAAGGVVVTDRYFLSSVAYQGARGLDPERILRDMEREFPAPDLALVLVVEAELGLERVRSRGGRLEAAFEREAFLERVADIFAEIDRPYVERLPAAAGADAVHAAVLEAVRRRLRLP